MPDTFQNRFIQAKNLSGLRWIDIANKAGLDKASISQYKNGIHVPEADTLYKLAVVLSVNLEWLMGYDAPMKPYSAPTQEDFDRWEKQYNPNGKLATEIMFFELITKKYNEDVAYAFSEFARLENTEAKKIRELFSMYNKMDEVDRAEVRGYVFSKIETMLKADKYKEK